MAKPSIQFFLIAMSAQLVLSPMVYAQYSRGRSAVVSGAKGAIVGAGVGALLGGKKGAATGALVGGGIGAVTGVRAANRANLASARRNAAQQQQAMAYGSTSGSASSDDSSSDDEASAQSAAPTYVSEKYFYAAMSKIPDPYKLIGSYYEFITNDTDGKVVLDPEGSRTILKVSDVTKITSCAARALTMVKRFTSPQMKVVMLYINNRLHQSKEADTYLQPSADLVAGVDCRMRDSSAPSNMIACTPDKIQNTYANRQIDLYTDVFYPGSFDTIPQEFRDGGWHSVDNHAYLISRMVFDPLARDYVVYHNAAGIEAQRTILAEMGRVHSATEYGNNHEFQPILNHELDILHRDYDRLPGEMTKSDDTNLVEIFKQIPMVEKRLVPRIEMQIGINSQGSCVLPNVEKLAQTYSSDWKKLMVGAAAVRK